jgi:hypothetical protein
MSQEITLEKERTKLERYLKKNASPNLVEDLAHLNLEQLKKRIQDQAIHKQDTITSKQGDDDLNKLKDQVRERNSYWNDQIRMNDKISRYISLLMKDLG